MLELAPGERLYCGYHEWAVHPDEARVILARGFVTMNGQRYPARQMDTLAGLYPLLRLEGIPGDQSDPQGLPSLVLVDQAA